MHDAATIFEAAPGRTGPVPSYADVAHLIDMTPVTEQVVPPVATVKQVQVQLGHQFRNRTLKPTKSDRALYHWILENADPTDYKFADVKNGDSPQHSNIWVEKHLNHTGKGRRPLPPIALWQVAAFRRGLTPDLFCRPRRAYQMPSITVRFDADAHQGQTDAKSLIDTINANFFDGKLHTAASRAGYSGWATFTLAAIEGQAGTYFERKTETNRRLNEVQAALSKWAAAEGFTATIEINGRYRITKTDESGVVTIAHRGSTFKVPRCENDGDVTSLIGAILPFGVFHTIITSAGESHEPTPAVQQQPRPRKIKSGSNRIIDKGDKVSNRLACVGRASRQVLPHDQWNADVADLSSEQLDAVINQANTLYESNNLHGNDRDNDRDQAFRRMLPYALSSNGEARDGKPAGLSFGELDLATAEQIVRSTISSKTVKSYNQHPVIRAGGFRITYGMLSWALCTYVKNVVTSRGQVPAASIRGMLEWAGFRVNGSVVALVTAMLTDAGQIVRTQNNTGGQWHKYERLGQVWQARPAGVIDKPYHPDTCNVYKLAGAARNLPFVENLNLDAAKAEEPAKGDSAARPAGANPHIITYPFFHHAPYEGGATPVITSETKTTDYQNIAPSPFGTYSATMARNQAENATLN